MRTIALTARGKEKKEEGKKKQKKHARITHAVTSNGNFAVGSGHLFHHNSVVYI